MTSRNQKKDNKIKIVDEEIEAASAREFFLRSSLEESTIDQEKGYECECERLVNRLCEKKGVDVCDIYDHFDCVKIGNEIYFIAKSSRIKVDDLKSGHIFYDPSKRFVDISEKFDLGGKECNVHYIGTQEKRLRLEEFERKSSLYEEEVEKETSLYEEEVEEATRETAHRFIEDQK